MSLAVYPGTFDPFTLGHLDIVRRARQIFDEVVVLLAVNPGKETLFPLERRRDLVLESVSELSGVRVDVHDGLLVEYARSVGAGALVRGLRAISDFEFEFQMALVNRRMAPELEAVFLMPSQAWSFLNSSIVRELWQFGGDFSAFVPEPVARAMEELGGTGDTGK